MMEGSLGAVARHLRTVPDEELVRYAIATDDEAYLTAEQMRELIARDDVPPGSFARPPIVRATGDKVKLHIPLSDEARYPFGHRTIVVPEILVAERLKVPLPIGDHNLESFGRREADLIAGRAVAQHNSGSTHHLVRIDDAPAPGLPDIITLRSL